MKHLLIKLPPYTFLISFVLSVALYLYLHDKLSNIYISLAVRCLPIFISSLWLACVAHFFCSEAKFPLLFWCVFLLILFSFAVEVTDAFFSLLVSELEPGTSNSYRLIYMLLSAAIAFVLTYVINKVMYARSMWFVFLEIFVSPYGMFSLSPAIQDWEKSDKT